MAVDKKAVAAGVIKAGQIVVNEISKSKALQKQIFGSYSDGNPRNLADAIAGEVHSPKERVRMEKQIEESKKKKRKKEKKGERYAKINL